MNGPNVNVGNGLKQQLEIFRLDIRKTLPIVKVGSLTPCCKRRGSLLLYKWHLSLGQIYFWFCKLTVLP